VGWLVGIVIGLLVAIVFVRRIRARRNRLEVGSVSDDWIDSHRADRYH
jgi:hypothetical protein